MFVPFGYARRLPTVTAVIFFLCSDVNMVLTTWYFSDRLTASSLAIKTLLTLIGSTVFFVFYYQGTCKFIIVKLHKSYVCIHSLDLLYSFRIFPPTSGSRC